MMKKSIILTSCLAIILLFGCSKDWLQNIEPQGKLLEANFYSTPDQAVTGLVGVYNMVKNNYFNGTWSSYYLMANLPSDDSRAVGGGPTDRPEFHSWDEYTSTPTTSGIIQQWQRCYYAIYRANVLITRTSTMTDPAVLDVQAEAKMIRAWMYFDLVRNFGQVPLIITELTPDEYGQAKSPEADIFAQIVKDLQEAALVLPSTRSGVDKYRQTKWGAIGLLGKVYMFMASPYYNLGKANYALAATQLKDVIDNSPYSLLTDYSQIWFFNNEFNAETLIEVSYGPSPSTALYWSQGSESQSNIIVQLDGPRGIEVNNVVNPGWGFDMVTQDLVDAYKAQGDSVRLHGTAFAEWQLKQIHTCDTCSDFVHSFDKQQGYTGYYTMKRTSWHAENPSAGVWSYSNNERILRLADIYLLYAEALNRQDGPQDPTALSYVNLVRERASLPALTGLTGDDLYKAIKLERRLELAQEGHRFYDLVRWEGDSDANKGDDAKSALVPLGFVLGKHEHYPIPNSEINNSEGLLVQNPAYAD